MTASNDIRTRNTAPKTHNGRVLEAPATVSEKSTPEEIRGFIYENYHNESKAAQVKAATLLLG